MLFAQTPEWQWAEQAGGTNNDLGKNIAIDSEGNSYVTGHFVSIAFFGSTSLTCNGMEDIFIAKMDTNGNWLWAKQAGGTNSDLGKSIALDSTGNSYVTGNFEGTATFGSTSLTSIGDTDIFVAKMDADGNWLYAISAGGSCFDFGCCIALDSAGNSYVTGYFSGTVTFGSISLTSSDNYDIFVAKMDADGNWLWATSAGGSSGDYSRSIALDSAGNSYVTGKFLGTATFGSTSLTISGDYPDIFAAKMDADGNWQWATSAGGSSSDYGSSIALDSTGNSYVTGCFQGTATFDSISLTSSGLDDIFVAKIDANGNWLWATKAGGSGIGSDCGYSIALDSVGNIYITGWFYETATFGSNSLTSCGSHDIFVAKLNSSVSADDEIIPTEIELSNYPNPFNLSTTIEFSIQNDSKIELSVYNIKGQKIKTLMNNAFTKGNHSVIWNGDDESGKSVSSGIYFFKLNVNGKTEAVKKCLLLK